jgi:hypothetical protein
MEPFAQQLKRESGKGLFVGGVKLPLASTELGFSRQVVSMRCISSGDKGTRRGSNPYPGWCTFS